MPARIASLAVISGLGAAALVASAASAQVSTPRAPDYIYRTTCGYCHGHNIGPIIRGRGLPTESIEYFVRHGNVGMPAFKPTEITREELAALAKWISESEADPKEHGK